MCCGIAHYVYQNCERYVVLEKNMAGYQRHFLLLPALLLLLLLLIRLPFHFELAR
jgi:hypothetical protein